MKESQSLSHITVNGLSLEYTAASVSNLNYEVGVPKSSSSPEVLGNLDALESTIVLGLLAGTAFAYGVAKQIQHRSEAKDWDERVVGWATPALLAGATAFYLVHAFSN
ncbi:hypothetical protein HY024_01005 [Candidatus Curtissbacteria bacterium]|nr:hypothetical protein [Candidatus Curtissbacteria bacterium]